MVKPDTLACLTKQIFVFNDNVKQVTNNVRLHYTLYWLCFRGLQWKVFYSGLRILLISDRDIKRHINKQLIFLSFQLPLDVGNNVKIWLENKWYIFTFVIQFIYYSNIGCSRKYDRIQGILS